MRVTFPCKRCGREITAEFTRPGKTAQCKGCNSTQEIPGEAPQTQYAAGKAPPPAAGGGGSGGGGSKKLLMIAVVVALAVAAWFLRHKFL
ncbi:MAG: hypothetical protein HUU15_08715 [Candidatus Brocadiae bacterium]|nr:hypothetical protein [Candidatus Brocadiia bacterium]